MDRYELCRELVNVVKGKQYLKLTSFWRETSGASLDPSGRSARASFSLKSPRAGLEGGLSSGAFDVTVCVQRFEIPAVLEAAAALLAHTA